MFFSSKHYKAKRTSAYRVVPPAYVASSPDNTPTTGKLCPF